MARNILNELTGLDRWPPVNARRLQRPRLASRRLRRSLPFPMATGRSARRTHIDGTVGATGGRVKVRVASSQAGSPWSLRALARRAWRTRLHPMRKRRPGRVAVVVGGPRAEHTGVRPRVRQWRRRSTGALGVLAARYLVRLGQIVARPILSWRQRPLGQTIEARPGFDRWPLGARLRGCQIFFRKSRFCALAHAARRRRWHGL